MEEESPIIEHRNGSTPVIEPNSCPDEHQNSVTPVKKPQSCFEKLRSTVTVEVVFLLYFFGYISYLSTLQQYVFARVSEDHGFVQVRLKIVRMDCLMSM